MYFSYSIIGKLQLKYIGHEKLSRAMSARGPFYIARSEEQVAVKLTEKDIIPPTIAVKNNYKLDLGGRVLILKAHPTAHTDNDLSVFDKKPILCGYQICYLSGIYLF
ncbi:hypothetical protein BMR02_07045 [Methylococcaceae bacterium HT1]|nr:hypothetical protein BMR02_07045 [Methylococcaceae bacterium HT1]TXL18579.1 hypothetical protein BMR04_00080 [Methylococcaceae bacterium HT3]TXL22331.1 hypothetical protein BMR03_08975 [Methylococcaceae bacterium HT2]